MSRGWMMVFVGAFFEVLWVVGLKHANDVLSWTGTIFAITLSFILLIRASTKLPVGTVYAVFTGLGTCGTVVFEMLFFGESFQIVKIILIILLLIGVLGLKLVTKEPSNQGGAA